MKLTVYTAIFGEYDSLKEPLFNDRNINYTCFTDSDLDSKNWKIIKVNPDQATSRRQARKIKILSHKHVKGDLTLWIDGTKYIKCNPIPYVKSILNTPDIYAPRHPIRNCLYDEADRCVEVGKAESIVARMQVDKYKNEGYPSNNGLVHTTVLLRRNTVATRAFERQWWNELNWYTDRDQISFNYAIWKTGTIYGNLDWRKIIGGNGRHDRNRLHNA